MEEGKKAIVVVVVDGNVAEKEGVHRKKDGARTVVAGPP